MIVDALSVSNYEKMVDYMPSRFGDLVFTGERIEVGLRRGKFDCLALTNKKPGANGEKENEEEEQISLERDGFYRLSTQIIP